MVDSILPHLQKWTLLKQCIIKHLNLFLANFYFFNTHLKFQSFRCLRMYKKTLLEIEQGKVCKVAKISQNWDLSQKIMKQFYETWPGQKLSKKPDQGCIYNHINNNSSNPYWHFSSIKHSGLSKKKFKKEHPLLI